jgi:deoxyribonuclease V
MIPPWTDYTPQEAIALQRELAARVKLRPLPERFDVLGCADISYITDANESVAMILTFEWPGLKLIETAHAVEPTRFPYISGLLSFREIPPLLAAYEKLVRKPDVFLCDGQGIAHPRGIGLASHMGLVLGIPSVGCAKTRLAGKHDAFELKRGNYTPLLLRGDVVGCVYCTRDNVKPVYISPGHLADLESSRLLVERCLGRYRAPEPLRLAHNYATRLRVELAAARAENQRPPGDPSEAPAAQPRKRRVHR